MRIAARILLATTVILVALPSIRGQEADTKTKDAEKLVIKDKGKDKDKDKSVQIVASDAQPEETPLKVQILISEFDGTQKISSLPYTLDVLGTGVHNRHDAHLRFGVRVPVIAGDNSLTYQDVGTNIDAFALQRDDGTYRLDLTVDRSSVISSDKGADWKLGESAPGRQPMIRSFRDEFTVVAKPGQTVEGTSAVDPVTGHVLKVEVSLSIVK